MAAADRRGPGPARRRWARLVPWAGVLLLVVLLVAPFIGSTRLNLARVAAAPLDWDGNPDAAIFFIARLPRVLLAALVGASLALAGAVFQSLLRNPLATPFTLGVSTGAALTTFLAMRWLPAGLAGELGLPAAAMVGAMLTVTAVLALSLGRRSVPPSVILLAGVTLNFTFGALIMLLQYFADFADVARMVHWVMGDLQGASYRLLAVAAVGMAPAWWLLLRRGRQLNLMSLGAEEAEAHGVDARGVTLGGLVTATWITGLAVAAAGPVGFVGIIVPHAVRLVGGQDYRVVLPGALLVGAAFLVLCDTGARTVLAPADLPVGVITASLGGPFFLALLLRRREVADV